jgi:nucleotide-binding universal stress UspA family protein
VKLLLTLDHSPASDKAVAFVGRVLGKTSLTGLEITLFHVVEALPEFILSRSQQSATTNAFRQVAEEWAQANQSGGERLVAEAQQKLTAAGIPASAIKTKFVARDALPESRRVVATLAIIDEIKSGDYEIVVVGRRGTSATVETLIGGVAEKVARECHGKTVWIVD